MGEHESVAAMSRSTWRRVRPGLTTAVFAATTVAGIAVGLQGATDSPVAPAATTVAQAGDQVSDAHHGHDRHR